MKGSINNSARFIDVRFKRREIVIQASVLLFVREVHCLLIEESDSIQDLKAGQFKNVIMIVALNTDQIALPDTHSAIDAWYHQKGCKYSFRRPVCSPNPW